MLSEAVGDDAHAELLKMLAFLRTWRPAKAKAIFASQSDIALRQVIFLLSPLGKVSTKLTKEVANVNSR